MEAVRPPVRVMSVRAPLTDSWPLTLAPYKGKLFLYRRTKRRLNQAKRSHSIAPLHRALARAVLFVAACLSQHPLMAINTGFIDRVKYAGSDFS